MYVPTRKIDNKTAVIAKDGIIFDAPVYREKEYDYDEFDDVVDECDSIAVC